MLVAAFLGFLLSNRKIDLSFLKQIGNAYDSLGYSTNGKYNVLYKRFILYNHKLLIFYVTFENEWKTGANFKSFVIVWISDDKNFWQLGIFVRDRVLRRKIVEKLNVFSTSPLRQLCLASNLIYEKGKLETYPYSYVTLLFHKISGMT